jgi:type III restriction enzyme
MATGSGKTLIMAGLMLYMYQKGYRNFLFFVHSNNIIQKTKDNFLKPKETKYLFADKISVEGEDVLIKEVVNFDEADDNNINIKFTTIQQLHSDLSNPKENSITYEDFENRKIVLIADEAHHLSSSTKKQKELNLMPTWENTVDKILNQSFENVLLEFTATLDYENQAIAAKYEDKVLYRYDLAEFRTDKYSKEINLVRSVYDEENRIAQALILNLYRQELATANNINLKPVILFKAKKTIKESEQNKENFHKLIDAFDGKSVAHIRKTSTVSIVGKAFDFFSTVKLSDGEIAKRIKSHFKEENCLSANNDKEAELNQIRLNTLEDESNPIRAIFAVQKLNEGWDVLNLFDIVRLYEGQNAGGNNKKIGKTTLSEAQLIGRGARYFPFKLDDDQDLYKRKYDDDVANDLKVLEELYYHTKEDNRYISELKKALIKTGIYEDDDNLVMRELTLKPEFKKTDFYIKGRIFYNKRVEKDNKSVQSFADLGITKKNFEHMLSSGKGQMTSAFSAAKDTSVALDKVVSKDIDIASCPPHVIRFALTDNPFYYFSRVIKFFPNIGSLSNFISNKAYLGGLKITMKGTKERLNNISHDDYLSAVEGLLREIERSVKSNSVEFEASKWLSKYVHEAFSDKQIRVNKNDNRADGQEAFVGDKDWYAYNANYGTSEEKHFVEAFARRFEALGRKYEDIFLLRNESELKIHNSFGDAFEPDFVLFCKQKAKHPLTYQVFIEPKGDHLLKNDKWKEDFLQDIRDDKLAFKVDTDQYQITGLPFYNKGRENDFIKDFDEVLDL